MKFLIGYGRWLNRHPSFALYQNVIILAMAALVMVLFGEYRYGIAWGITAVVLLPIAYVFDRALRRLRGMSNEEWADRMSR